MQHFKKNRNTLEDMSNTLVFSQEALQKLYSRVEELKKETQILKEKQV
jgi:polyhydroxyalkanoate synthesis regulator phasin